MKVESMSKASGNALMASPEEALKDAIETIGECGALEQGKKVLILALDDTQDNFSIGFFQAGMRMSECLAVCETAKSIFLKEMGYLVDE